MEYLVYIFVLCVVISVIVTHFVIQCIYEKYQKVLCDIHAISKMQSRTESEIEAISDRVFDMHENLTLLVREGSILDDIFTAKVSKDSKQTDKTTSSHECKADNDKIYQAQLPGFNAGDEIVCWHYDPASPCSIKTVTLKNEV